MIDRRYLLTSAAAATLLPASLHATGSVPVSWTAEWPNTDFSRCAIDISQILSGGPPKDGIPALDQVRFGDAAGLSAREPVITVAIDGAAERAYPVRYLMWHEIANDDIDGLPVSVTYCPLCNSALVFDRRVDGKVLSFGVSGKLRHSDMIMYDRQTESWWQQFEGKAIIGALEGTVLTQLVSWMEPVEAFVARNSGGLVMQEPKGFSRAYGRNPYRGYDSSDSPFLYRGENPPHGIAPLMRVVRVGNRAWPMDRVMREGEINEANVRIYVQGVMASALDTADIGKGREIGVIRVQNAAGENLVHEIVFAFAFHAFAPTGIWMLGEN